jgi:hypothetical protein
MAAVGDLSATDPSRDDRRDRHERRHHRLWSLIYGSFHPRRRSVRRTGEGHVEMVDWHPAHLLGVAIAILLLSSMDAFLTLTLLTHGAQEVNPMMAGLLYHDIAIFAAVKMGLTGFGVATLVVLSRCRVFGRVRVDLGLYLTLLGYILLVIYEFSLLHRVL